ncbi:MAG: hypothetical protein O7E52_23010 [Candidatus Poribacteria bacterium]|nr:hypothetical protein [Candidatus Poribacteria bacterium]
MAQDTDLLFNTPDWVEVYRTTDEWESNLIQTMLSNQQIRCRPEHTRGDGGQRQIILFVDPEDQVAALEIVSQIGLAVTDDEYEKRREASGNQVERDYDFQSESELPQATPASVEAIMIAEREGIGKIAHHVGRGYELQVGPVPYYMVEEDRWEEFTDFSAQRQEFSILLHHEYPNLSQWLKQGKLMAEFIHLVESTYRDVAPPRPRNQRRTPSSSPNPDTTDARISNLAKFSLWVSLVSLAGVLIDLPWYASLTLSLLAAATGFVAKYRIDASGGSLKGSVIAFLAIIIACIVIAITWKQHQSSQPEPSDLRVAHLLPPTPIKANTNLESNLTSV